jgi:hypothetical protein
MKGKLIDKKTSDRWDAAFHFKVPGASKETNWRLRKMSNIILGILR